MHNPQINLNLNLSIYILLKTQDDLGKIYKDSQKKVLAHISSKANSFMAIKLLKLLREKQPDIIISTHPFGSQMCSYLKQKGKIHSKIATIMTDFKSHDQWLVGSDYTDFFFVSNSDMREELIKKILTKIRLSLQEYPLESNF